MKSLLRSPVIAVLLGYVIWAWMSLVSRTTRWRVEGDAEARAFGAGQTAGFVVACWHENILLVPSGWNRCIRRWPERRGRAAMMISLSPDGESISHAIQHLDIDLVRGSSANKKKAAKDKGGMRALVEAGKRLRDGGYICMTPDGPRGPRRIASAGAVTLAQRAGAAVLPYAISVRPGPRLNSWDRFVVPMPFARGAIVFGPPVDCARQDDLVQLQQTLQTAMDTATRRAEELAGYPAGPDAAGAAI